MTLSPSTRPRRSQRNDTGNTGGAAPGPARVAPSRVHPAAVGLVIGTAAAYLVAGHVMRVGSGEVLDSLALVAAHGVVFGVAGAALAIGRRAGAPGVLVLALATLLLDPVRLATAWLPIPRGLRLLTVGDVSLTGLTVLLALFAAGAAWIVREQRAEQVAPVRPAVIGPLVAGFVLLVGTNPGVDPDAWPWLALYAAAAGLGAAWIPLSVYHHRRRQAWLGWVAIGGLPVVHSAWVLDSPDPEAWTVILLDVTGYGISVTAGLAIAIVLTVRGWSHEPWRRAPRAGERRTLVGLSVLALIGAALLGGAPVGRAEHTWVLDSADQAGPFTLQATLDQGTGTITAPGTDPGTFRPGTAPEMAVTIQSGSGRVSVDVRRLDDPEAMFDLEVGPNEWTSLTGDHRDTLTIDVRADPAWVEAPGGTVTVRLTVTAGPDNRQGLPITGLADAGSGDMIDLRDMDTGRDDSCARILQEAPIDLAQGETVACTYALEAFGEPGYMVSSEVWITTPIVDEEGIVIGPWLGIPVIAAGDPPPQPGPDASPEDAGRHAASMVVPIGDWSAEPIALDAIAPLVITIDAPQGSADFQMEVSWTEIAPTYGQALAVGWLAAALVGLAVVLLHASPITRRVAAAVLGLAGTSVPATLWLTGERDGPAIVGGLLDWYFGPGFLLLALACLALTTIGLLFAIPPPASRLVRRTGAVVLVVGLLTAATSLVIGTALPPLGLPTAPFGDYWAAPVHATTFVAATLLLATGALLTGRARPNPVTHPPHEGSDG
jgi:hypothetical protein